MIRDNNKMEYQEQINNAKYILDNIKDWINNVDIKISILIAFMGVILGYILIDSNTDIIQKIIISVNNNNITFIKIVKGTLIVLLYSSAIFAIIKLVHTLKGKINIEDFRENGVTLNSLIFYGSISDSKYDDFKSRIKNQTEESNINDLLSQVYINSKICNKKFQNYNQGLNIANITVILLFIAKIWGII